MVDININYNEKYLLIVKDKKDYQRYKFSFKNIMILKNDSKCLRNVSKFIKKNNFVEIIFLDYENIYIQLINSFEIEYSIKFIYTRDLGTLSNLDNYNMFLKIYDLYQDNVIDEIGFVDKYFYDAFKDKIKCSHIIFDMKESKKMFVHNDTIRILNDSNDLYHSYFNELSAITLLDKKVVLKKKDNVVKNFVKMFNVDYEKKNNKFERSIVDLYVNFSDNDIFKVLESMDEETICIVGNTWLFDSNNYLKEKLVMKSDDDINEIKDRILDVIKNKDKIINEYKKFRKEYSNNSRKSVMNFTRSFEIKSKSKSELLLTVIVPVYNTELYLENTIKSILDARIKNMEIILINDGSSDNSESIIMKYVNKYPKLIRYYKKKNEGLGSVRNLGLKLARGKYIASVDSDDQISKNFFKDALKYLKKDIDMVVYDWKTYDINSSYDTLAVDYIYKNRSIYEGLLYTTIMPSQCNKIIKKSIYEDMKLTYRCGKYEDYDTNAIALLNVKTFKYINKPYYKYYIRNSSIMRSKPKHDMIDAIKNLDDRLKEYEKFISVNINEYKYNLYSWRIEEYIINVLYDLDEKERNSMIDYMCKKIKDILVDIFNSEYYQEMLNRQSIDKKNYLIERNKSIKNDRLKYFIAKRIKENNYEKITPVEMIYNKQ